MLYKNVLHVRCWRRHYRSGLVQLVTVMVLGTHISLWLKTYNFACCRPQLFCSLHGVVHSYADMVSIAIKLQVDSRRKQ